MTAVTINFNPIITISDDQFYQLCRANPDIQFERNPQGEIIIMSPLAAKPAIVMRKSMLNLCCGTAAQN